ncbi:MAG: hypothetical protein ACK456_07435 [Pseudanabaenaceae cyanobacterium]|jgi:hypothetical protein
MNKNIVHTFNALAVATTFTIAISAMVSNMALAKPDSAFNPILGQIKQEMPTNWTIRLPSELNFFDRNRKKMVVYPNLVWKRTELLIRFSSTPRCRDLSCLIGAHIEIYPSSFSKDSNSSNGDRITLQSGIYGIYSGNYFSPYDPRVGSRGRMHGVRWQQDEMTYRIVDSCPSIDRDENEFGKKSLIEMAISMSKGTAIRSATNR